MTERTPEDEAFIAKKMTEMAGDLQNKEKAFNVWACLTCEEKPTLTQGQVMEHLRDVHGVPPGTLGNRNMVTHLDARDWYQTNYQVEIGGVQLTQSVRNPRSKRNQIR